MTLAVLVDEDRRNFSREYVYVGYWLSGHIFGKLISVVIPFPQFMRKQVYK